MKSGFFLPPMQFHSFCPHRSTCCPSWLLLICKPFPLQAFNSSSMPHKPTISYTRFCAINLFFCLVISQLPLFHLCQFTTAPDFFHIFWPTLCGWPGGQEAACVLTRCCLDGQSLSPAYRQMLHQILPAILSESREKNNSFFSKQCLS